MPKPRSGAGLSVRDILVIFFCTAGTAAFLILFWLDLNSTFMRQNEEPVGTITWKYKAAQRRFSDRVLWDRLRRDSPVYNGDFIRTASMSEASIGFINGGEISLLENSLVQIFALADGFEINVSEGFLSAKAESEMVITSGSRRLVMESGSSVNTGAGSDGSFSVQVTGGSTIYREAGKSEKLESGSAISVNAAGQEQKTTEAVALSPLPNARLYIPAAGSNASVDFAWTKQNYLEETRLDIAHDRSFKKIVTSESTGRDRHTVSLPGPGTYYWRIYPAGENPKDARIFRLSAEHISVPVLLNPPEGQIIQYRSDPQIRFQWNVKTTGSSAGPESYKLELADNPGMANPVFILETRNKSLTASPPGPGRWYWRITPVHSSASQTEPSETASFTLEQKVELAEPVLQHPADNGTISAAAGQNTVFSWKKDADAAGYTLQISRDKNLSNPVLSRTIRDNFFSLPSGTLQEGTYYWVVYQNGKDGTASPVSTVRSFTVMEGTEDIKTIYPPDGYTVSESLMQDLRFSWKPKAAGKAMFQVSAASDFSGLLINEPVSGEGWSGKSLPPGNYYWRIETGTIRTPGKRLIVAPMLPVPELLKVSAGYNPVSQILLLGMGTVPVFSWRPVAGAEFYNLKLYRGENAQGNPVYESPALRSPSLELSMNGYEEGSYTWTVQAFIAEGQLYSRRSSPVKTERFIFNRLKPVTLDYPEPGRNYSGMDAVRRPDTIRWSSTEPPANVRFILARNRDLSGRIMELSSPPAAIVLPQLGAGDYFWTIQARTAREGLDISASSPSWFRVLPIPPFPPPVNQETSSGASVIGPDDLRTDRTIGFSWDPVPNADGYIFSLYRKTNSGQKELITRTEIIKDTSFTITDLSTLGRGNFIWETEAVGGVRNGTIDQRGTVRENHFSIDLPPLRQNVQNDPGEMYGR